MSNIIGYARVSTTSQNLDAQIDALKQAVCAKTFTDKDSGTKFPAPVEPTKGSINEIWRLF